MLIYNLMTSCACDQISSISLNDIVIIIIITIVIINIIMYFYSLLLLLQLFY
jgi:hypothetical protein